MTDMRDQRWGLELEFTGLTRFEAAKVISQHFGNPYSHSGGIYDKYTVLDGDGRTWSLVSDGSIKTQRREGVQVVDAHDNHYSVELVTPICSYNDIEPLQEIVRSLRKAGALVNASCGIHVHVDGVQHTPQNIRNLINIVASKNTLLYQALEIAPERQYFCKALDRRLIEQMNRRKPKTMREIENIWYEANPDDNRERHSHYHQSRYHLCNLHSFFNGNGTIELRGFNSTLHAGKVKTYVQLSLAMCHQAKRQRSASRTMTETDNPKYTFRTYLLRLGLIGEEFETLRGHLLKPLPGDIAFRHPQQREAQKERQRLAREMQEAAPAQGFEPVLEM